MESGRVESGQQQREELVECCWSRVDLDPGSVGSVHRRAGAHWLVLYYGDCCEPERVVK